MIREFLEAVASVMINIASSILGVSEDFFKILFEKKKIVKSEKKQQEILSEKINRLTVSLHESSQLMNEIEEEFEKQKELAKIWEEKADTSKAIAEMHQEEIDAVSKILTKQLKNESKKSDKKAFIWNVVFCVIGILGGYFISKLLP